MTRRRASGAQRYVCCSFHRAPEDRYECDHIPRNFSEGQLGTVGLLWREGYDRQSGSKLESCCWDLPDDMSTDSRFNICSMAS